MRRFIYLLFILSFAFSHQFENSYEGGIPSFTKTPNPGKVAINEIYQMKTAKKIYGSGGKTTSIEKLKLNSSEIKLDYLGMHGVGLSYSYNKSDIEQGLINSDLKEISSGIYYLWNNIIGGVDLHDLTFKLTRIKSGVIKKLAKLDVDGTESKTYAAIVNQFAIDFIISDNIIWSNLKEIQLSGDDELLTLNFNSRLIYDVSEKASAAIEFNRTDINPIINNEDQYENLLKLYGSYQFSDIQWGNLNFNLKIVPFYSHSLSGKNYFKTSSMGVQFHTYFK